MSGSGSFLQKKFGALNVDHTNSQALPMLCHVKYSGAHFPTQVECVVAESHINEFWKLLAAVFEEGKRERSLEIQRALNGGEQMASKHTITITDKRNGG